MLKFYTHENLLFKNDVLGALLSCDVQVLVLTWRTSSRIRPCTLPLAMATPPSPRPWPATEPTSCAGGRGACCLFTWPVSAATLIVWRPLSQSVSAGKGQVGGAGKGHKFSLPKFVCVCAYAGHDLSSEVDSENRTCLHAAACGG